MTTDQIKTYLLDQLCHGTKHGDNIGRIIEQHRFNGIILAADVKKLIILALEVGQYSERLKHQVKQNQELEFHEDVGWIYKAPEGDPL